MKLSERTLQILKNFSTVNQSILVRPGNIIKTMSPLKTIVTRAEVEETFEHQFAIYDLSRFLGVISLFNEPEFEFTSTYVTITSGKQRVNYTYASETMVPAPPSKDINFPDTEVEFTLSSEALSTIARAGSVLQMPEIAIVGEDGVITVRAIDSKVSTADVFSVDVGSCTKDFEVIFKPENLKLIPAEYTVALTSMGISRFEAAGLTYWVATESKGK